MKNFLNHQITDHTIQLWYIIEHWIVKFFYRQRNVPNRSTRTTDSRPVERVALIRRRISLATIFTSLRAWLVRDFTHAVVISFTHTDACLHTPNAPLSRAKVLVSTRNFGIIRNDASCGKVALRRAYFKGFVKQGV